MAKKTKPLTKQELLKVFDSYSDAFANWNKDAGTSTYFRTSGPVKQQVWFERLRSGGYRPSSGVRILVAPGVAMLHQFLDVRHRQILLSRHEAMRLSVIEGMMTQFLPHINQPLNVAEVLRLCEAEATDHISDICGVAALAAHQGKNELARKWCEKAEASMISLGRKPAEWELAYHNFVKQLEIALKSNTEAAFLNTFIED
ncbi:hypothetical protein ACYFX5_17540 [Bremerella sp. T1]|uniref:hypothetical protein n=1 Tax=Bremerella sp. TYQ1 TaxID=3119568 RepID=UPI001CCEFD85|nr:hypothetical protein [Bremerella volcania]UBM34860.1 hypothetical protein LA756_19490 [Bremerella volcania]